MEETARQLEPTLSDRTSMAEEAAWYINRFIESIPADKSYITGNCDNLKALKVQDTGKPFAQLLSILREEVDRIGINSASGGHLGYLPAGGIWTSAMADMLAAATNRYAGIFYSSPGAVLIENQMIQWLCSVVGYAPGAQGNLTSGGSMANLIAIQTARDSFNIMSANVKQSVIYYTEHAHHCIHKALRTIGLHEAICRIIPMNSNYQMDTELLRNAMAHDKDSGLSPFLIIATAGTTDTGAIDPLEQVAALCSEYKAWFHVDAAYGGFFMLLDEIKAQTDWFG